MNGWVVSKGGTPFLWLPQERPLAARALSLYPAQTWRARLGRTGLKLLLHTPFPLPLKESHLPLAEGTPWVEFLIRLAGRRDGGAPPLAILAGNPEAAGRRLIVLLFDEAGEPATVLKAGVGTEAIGLIRKEREFLETNEKVPYRIALRGHLETGEAHALVFPYLSGRAFSEHDWKSVGPIVTAWLKPEETGPLAAIPGWQRLMEALSLHAPASVPTLAALNPVAVVPAVYHGDFAPWNVRRTDRGDCVVIDWERGESLGVPGWDWFHFLIQSQMLAAKAAAPQILARLEELLKRPAFRLYAREARIEGIERQLVSAYLKMALFLLEQKTLPTVRTLDRLWDETVPLKPAV